MMMVMMMMMMMVVQAAWAGVTTAMAAITVTGEATEDRDPAPSQLEGGGIFHRASNEGSDSEDPQSRRRVFSWLKTLIINGCLNTVDVKWRLWLKGHTLVVAISVFVKYSQTFVRSSSFPRDGTGLSYFHYFQQVVTTVTARPPRWT